MRVCQDIFVEDIKIKWFNIIMITQLTIQNFGLIDNVSIELYPGLNIFTGETGAGKSILIDALRYALGERLVSSQIRNPDVSCSAEVVFDLPKNNNIFSEYTSKDDSSFIIYRSFTPDGKNKIKINGKAVTISQLKEIGDLLIDFHGPHDHQLLLKEDLHIGILDRLCSMDSLKNEYEEKYNIYTDFQKKLSEVQKSAESRDRELDLLSHQIKELEQAPLIDTKYEELLQAQKRINNAEKLYECVNNLIQIMDNEKTGITEAIRQAMIPMKTFANIDDKAGEFAERLNHLQDNSKELLYDLQNYLGQLSFEPEEAKDIYNRCDIYYEIKRKYGPTLEDAREFYLKTKERHDFLVNLEHNDKELREKIDKIKTDLLNLAQKITKERKKTGLFLQKTIEKELKELGIANVQFECRLEKTELNPNGQDKVTFYISPNAGEELKPLANIVSSGEAARLMLALKKALIKVDSVPVLIFDEIDSQIGGRLGAITGKKLKELSNGRQVILITHLPQIASFSDIHFKVSKKVENNRTITVVSQLNSEEKVKELAKMMSGEKETDIAVTHAHEMLARAKKT